jgi:hypothetical protein
MTGELEMQRKWKVSAAVTAAFALVAGIASTAASPGVPPIDQASDIVPAMASGQLVSDRLPGAAANEFTPAGIEPTSTRWLGESGSLRYYSAPLGSDKICIITVGDNDAAQMMGCTLVKGFEGYGLRVTNADRSEEAWLTVGKPSEAQNAKSVSPTWTEANANFFVKSSAIKH